MKIAILGVGNMGSAFADGFLRAGIVDPQELTLIDHSSEKLSKYVDRCKVIDTFPEQIPADTLSIFAIKPQTFFSQAEQLSRIVKSSEILSLMAGVTVKRIKRSFPNAKISRCMPNLGVKIGQGMTALYISEDAEPGTREKLETLLEPLGETLCVNSEELLHAATAVSGSGPGFVYLFMQYFCSAAQRLGFSPEEALLLTSKTFDGAIALQRQENLTPESLKNAVASVGGTTAAGLESFDSNNLEKIVQTAINSAYNRAKELAAK